MLNKSQCTLKIGLIKIEMMLIIIKIIHCEILLTIFEKEKRNHRKLFE